MTQLQLSGLTLISLCICLLFYLFTSFKNLSYKFENHKFCICFLNYFLLVHRLSSPAIQIIPPAPFIFSRLALQFALSGASYYDTFGHSILFFKAVAIFYSVTYYIIILCGLICTLSILVIPTNSHEVFIY